jgi:predicted PhzF superfamily epimerase YddE/YHI9
MFHPGASGLTEDPATGSATVAAAALLADLSGERDGELKLRIGQGVDMGRPSLLLTRVRKANGALTAGASHFRRHSPMCNRTSWMRHLAQARNDGLTPAARPDSRS